MKNSITFIVPCYNESTRLELAEKSFTNFFMHSDLPCKIIFVDDGSKDDTKDRLMELIEHLNFINKKNIADVISYSKNAGKGYALKAGIEAANSQWILTIDADMAASPDELLMWNRKKYIDLQNPDTVYIGSREKGIESHLVKSSFFRRNIGLVFNYFTQLLTRLPFQDTQCGFKLYPTALAQEVFQDLYDYGFAHDVEVLLKIQQKGVPIQNLPLRWTEISGSKVNVFKDSIRMFKTIYKVRKRYR